MKGRKKIDRTYKRPRSAASHHGKRRRKPFVLCIAWDEVAKEWIGYRRKDDESPWRAVGRGTRQDMLEALGV